MTSDRGFPHSPPSLELAYCKQGELFAPYSPIKKSEGKVSAAAKKW